MQLAAIIVAEMILASIVTAILYLIDKRAARAGRRRVPERVLLSASLLGGWPGGLIASKQFRHKTQKRSYRLRFVLASMAHVTGAIGFLYLWN